MTKAMELKSTSSKEAQIDDQLDALASKLISKTGTGKELIEFQELLARRGRLMRPTKYRIKKKFA